MHLDCVTLHLTTPVTLSPRLGKATALLPGGCSPRFPHAVPAYAPHLALFPLPPLPPYSVPPYREQRVVVEPQPRLVLRSGCCGGVEGGEQRQLLGLRAGGEGWGGGRCGQAGCAGRCEQGYGTSRHGNRSMISGGLAAQQEGTSASCTEPQHTRAHARHQRHRTPCAPGDALARCAQSVVSTDQSSAPAAQVPTPGAQCPGQACRRPIRVLRRKKNSPRHQPQPTPDTGPYPCQRHVASPVATLAATQSYTHCRNPPPLATASTHVP